MSCFRAHYEVHLVICKGNIQISVSSGPDLCKLSWKLPSTSSNWCLIVEINYGNFLSLMNWRPIVHGFICKERTGIFISFNSHISRMSLRALRLKLKTIPRSVESPIKRWPSMVWLSPFRPMIWLLRPHLISYRSLFCCDGFYCHFYWLEV